MENGLADKFLFLFIIFIIAGIVVYGTFFAVYFLTKKLKAYKLSHLQKAMYRWAIFLAGITALFWEIWWLIKGKVPVVDIISFGIFGEIQSPFAISRWWDILAGPIWIVIFIYLFSKIPEDFEFNPVKIKTTMAMSTLVAMALGFATGIVNGMINGLAMALGTGIMMNILLITCFGLFHVFRFIFCKSSWKKIWEWLSGN